MSGYTFFGLWTIACALAIWACALHETLRRLRRDLRDARHDAWWWEDEATIQHKQVLSLETCVAMLDAEIVGNPLGTRGSA